MTVEIMPPTMKAVVLKAPYKVVCEERPTPQLSADDQVILKVLVSGLCGRSRGARLTWADIQVPIFTGIGTMPSRSLGLFWVMSWSEESLPRVKGLGNL